AKVMAWGVDRTEALHRIRRALDEIALIGPATTLPILQLIVRHPEFVSASYDTDSLRRDMPEDVLPEHEARELAVAAAIAYVRRTLTLQPTTPERLQSGWHRSSRRLPE
ncbi:MAG: biotin carboxylase, partial [Anaerolineae bacterium]